MSLLDSYRRTVQDTAKKISQALAKKGKETESISKENTKIANLKRQINSTSSLTLCTRQK